MSRVRIAIGRTVRLSDSQSLHLDVAHELEAVGDRAAAVAEATRLCREDLDALFAAEASSRVVAREDIDTLLFAQHGVADVLKNAQEIVALLNDLAQSGSLTGEQLERSRAVLARFSENVAL